MKNKYDYFDWYDHDKIAKLQERRSRQWIKIYAKMLEARDKGDEQALAVAKESMRKHEQVDSVCKQKANATGFYWC